MEKYKIIEVKESVFADNDREAARVRAALGEKGTFLLNLMSSPGSGKTTTLLRTIERLRGELRMGVMEADIDSDVDARTISETGVKSIQLHTGGMCHLDAGMTEQGLREIGTDELDLVVLENVGNLVCPAEFDTGAVKNAMILSVPEGHDKPLKYPLIFTVCAHHQQDRCPAVFRLRHGEGRRVRAHAQPEAGDFSHLRQDRRGRGRVVRVAARAGRRLEKGVIIAG